MPFLNARETKRRIQTIGIEDSRGSGFTFIEKAIHLAYEWHHHSRHQLIYSLSGRVILQSKGGRWLLPPERAAWIPAGVKHQTTLDRAEVVTVFFKAAPRSLQPDDIRVIRTNPLLREMLLYSRRWPAVKPGRGREETLRRSFFTTLANLCAEWIDQELPFVLPTPRDEPAMRAVAHLLHHIDTATMESAARASGQSVRTMRRRFLPATGMTWDQYARQARLLHAMDLLLTTRKGVTEIALACGYESPSAFAKAFAQFSGHVPTAFRQKT